MKEFKLCKFTKFKPAITLKFVEGLLGRFNHILYSPPLINGDQQDANDIVIFFGGDIQDFHHEMVSKEVTREHSEWSLENTSKILSMHYTNCHCIIVRPSSQDQVVFNKYPNYVQSECFGTPQFLPNHGSIPQLIGQMRNLNSALLNLTDEQIKICQEHTCKALNLEQCCFPDAADYRKNFADVGNIELIGFSKGCVVLNQFLHEFHYYKNNPVDVNSNKVRQLIARIKVMRWMDGGHCGRETWITSKEIIATYAEMCKKTFVHVTPYQIGCKRRPWLGQEESEFTQLLQEKGVDLTRTLQSSEGTLKDHFRLLLDVFTPVS